MISFINWCDNNYYHNFTFLACKEGDIRLVGGKHKFEGTVEICLDSSWTVVAQNGWDDDDARVVCRQIGGYNASGKIYNICQ